jgi:hypothetical protein
MMKTLIAAVALTLAGCAYGRGATPGTTLTSAPGTPVQLIVTNNSGAPMQVYAVGTGTSWRMGTVLPGLVGHFVLPQAMLGSDAVEFLASPGDGNPPVRSGRLVLAPGNVVDFEIEAQALTSTARVRP